MRGDILSSGLSEDGPSARWCRLAVGVAASAGYAASIQAIWTLVAPFEVTWWWWTAAVMLVLMPIAIGSWGGRPETRLRLGVAPLVLLLGFGFGTWAVARMGLGRSGAAVLLITLLMVLQGFQVGQIRRNEASARASLWMSLCQVFCALTIAPGPTLYLLLPLCLGALLVGLVLLHGREARRGAQRSLRADLPDEGVPALARRVTFAASLTMALLFLSTLAYPVATAAPWTYLIAQAPVSDDDATRRDRRNRGDGTAGVDATPTLSSEADLEGDPLPTPEIFLYATPHHRGRPTGDLGPIYLRGLILSRFTRHGIGMRDGEDPDLLLDDDDGTADGWIVLPDADLSADTMELEIEQFPLRIEPEGWALLYGPAPLQQVEMDSVGYDPERLLVSGPSRRDWFRYRVRGRHPGLAWSGLDLVEATHPDGLYLELPEGSDDLDWIAAQAAAITSGARNDIERVRLLETHFRQTFGYELAGASTPGVRGLAEFLRRKSGFCVHFATAATLMLRTQGVPARVVTGFLAKHWSVEDARYEVRSGDMHAWIEVHFQGVGWVPFDATPIAPGTEAVAPQRRLLEPGVGAWAGGLTESIGDWISDRMSTSELVDALVSAVPALFRSVARQPLAFGAYLLSLLSLVLVWYLRRRAERRGGPPRARSEADRLYDRLLAALARLGYRKRRAQTPREFAAEVARDGGEALAPVVPLTERFYAERFGGRPLAPADRDRLLQYLGQLRGVDPRGA